MSRKLMMNNYGVVKEHPVILVKGSTFNYRINQLKQRATQPITSIVFTKNKIPNDKIVESTIMSESFSEYVAYGYIEGDVIYISPEINNGILVANSNCLSMFQGLATIKFIDLSNFDTSNVTNMDGMFYGCSSLTNLDLSNFDTSNVTDMTKMFRGCSLTNLDLSNFNTNNLISMSYMFNGCSSLTNVDLSNFDTSNVINMNATFTGCTKIISSIIIRNSNITTYNNTFGNTATLSSAEFIVKYIDEPTKIMAEKLIATKSINSNVILQEGE